MKPHEFEALVRTKAPVVKQAPEPVVESLPAPVLEAMDIDSLDHQYQTMLDEGWFDNQTSDAENDAKVAGRRNFLKAVGTGLAGAGLAAAGLGASQNAQADNAPEIKMQDARHGTVAYQGKNIPITLNDTTRAMGTLAKAKLNGQTVDIYIRLDGARAWIPPSAMPHMGESMMAGGTEAYTTEDEQLDGMALGELQAIAQAAKKIYASVKQGVPLEAWMYKKITNGNEGLTAVAQQINNPAVREQQGVAEGSEDDFEQWHAQDPKDEMYGVGDAYKRGIQDYKKFKQTKIKPGNPYSYTKQARQADSWDHGFKDGRYKQGVAEGEEYQQYKVEMIDRNGKMDGIYHKDNTHYNLENMLSDIKGYQRNNPQHTFKLYINSNPVNWKELVAKQGVAESFPDDILAMAKKVSPNARTRGSRDEEIARRDAMLAQREKDRMHAPEPKGISDDERAGLEAELQQLMPKYDRHYQMIDNYTQHMQAKHIADRVHEIQRKLKPGMAEIKDPNDSRWSQKYSKDLPESTDFELAVNQMLNEFAGGMGVGSVAVGPGAMKNPAKTGSLFGGSYTQKNSPFKKKATKKESVIKR